MLLRAFAKVNLDLRILGLRPDGYHEVRTTLQTIEWFDEIRIELADRFEFVSSGGTHESPNDASNLVVRAVREFESAIGEPVNVHVELVKNIPSGSGLGGGSADAAVTLLGLQQICGKHLPSPEFLRCLRALGSDVPFFAVGGRAIGIGRGDEVIPEPELREDGAGDWLVIVLAGVRISTAEAYSWLTVSGESPTIKGFCTQSAGGREAGLSTNDFEKVVFGRHPVLSEIKSELLRLGARQAALSGSGSAIFGLFAGEEDALKVASGLSRYGTVRVVRLLSRREYLRRIFVNKS